jgi:hypothetical protein
MNRIKTYDQFHYDLTITESKDAKNFNLIFVSLYNHHLSINEKKIIESDFGIINESWFSDLVDKGKRGVLSVKSAAGQILVDLAKKAKDILDFAKQLANKIGEYVKEQFSSLSSKVKNYAMKDNEFSSILLEFIESKKLTKLKSAITSTAELLKYIASGQIISDLTTRLSECFSKALNLGTNEGFYTIDDRFLFEAEEQEEKKSFLQRLGEKIMTFPPFSWIPKIEEMMKKGISFLSKTIDRFFSWLLTGKDSLIGSRFVKSFNFLFQILQLYVYYKIIGQIEKFKDFLNQGSGLEDLSDKIQDKSLDAVWNAVGINSEEIVSNVKNAVKKIPFVGDILSVLDSLVIAIGTYLAVEPTLKKLIA